MASTQTVLAWAPRALHTSAYIRHGRSAPILEIGRRGGWRREGEREGGEEAWMVTQAGGVGEEKRYEVECGEGRKDGEGREGGKKVDAGGVRKGIREEGGWEKDWQDHDCLTPCFLGVRLDISVQWYVSLY